MTDTELLNAFLQRPDLSSAEQALKEQMLATDRLIKSNTQEREKLLTSLKDKESEYLRLSGAFDSQLSLIISLAKATQFSVSGQEERGDNSDT
jgi:hypothetical protein